MTVENMSSLCLQRRLDSSPERVLMPGSIPRPSENGCLPRQPAKGTPRRLMRELVANGPSRTGARALTTKRLENTSRLTGRVAWFSLSACRNSRPSLPASLSKLRPRGLAPCSPSPMSTCPGPMLWRPSRTGTICFAGWRRLWTSDSPSNSGAIRELAATGSGKDVGTYNPVFRALRRSRDALFTPSEAWPHAHPDFKKGEHGTVPMR